MRDREARSVQQGLGQEGEARRLAATVNWDRLKPQERDLIRTLRAPPG